MPPSAFADHRPSITVSIVSHRQFDLIRPLLEQLDAHSAGSVSRIVLTFNVPEADDPDDMALRIPITCLRNAKPQGFGANHNQAFKHCDTSWFLVLNPDIRFDQDVLPPLIAQAADQAGLLTPRILEPGKNTPEPHRAIITPLEILTRRRPGYPTPSVPAWIPGLFMLFRSEAFRQIGGFDERFFMYGEDFDICARTCLAGWKLQVAENLVVRHDAQRASHADRRHLYWHISSLLRVWCSSAFWRYWRLEPMSRGSR